MSLPIDKQVVNIVIEEMGTPKPLHQLSKTLFQKKCVHGIVKCVAPVSAIQHV